MSYDEYQGFNLWKNSNVAALKANSGTIFFFFLANLNSVYGHYLAFSLLIWLKCTRQKAATIVAQLNTSEGGMMAHLHGPPG